MVNGCTTSGLAAVLGAGAMGCGIAAQLANAGWSVLLLDVAAPGDPPGRSRAAEAALEGLTKRRPPLLFTPALALRIRAGSVEGHLEELSAASWIVEAVVERMEVKRSLLERVGACASADAVVSSNTSGLSLAQMSGPLGPDLRRRFLGTHFLNPPRYLKLLEIAATSETDPQVLDEFHAFAEDVLGHRVVRARDTPGFISTRLWLFHLLDTIHQALRFNLSVTAVDYLTGPLIGRPRTGTFRMADLVGLDIITAVAENQKAALPADPRRDSLELPEPVARLLSEGATGDKAGRGFYRKGKEGIEALDLRTGEYRPREAPRDLKLDGLAGQPLSQSLPALLKDESGDVYRQFLRSILFDFMDYANEVGPEVAASVLDVDRVMEWGFGWQIGPFRMEDALRSSGILDSHGPRNYLGQGADLQARFFDRGEHRPAPPSALYMTVCEAAESGGLVWQTGAARLVDIGEHVACLEFRTKLGTFNPELSADLVRAIEEAESRFTALVLGSDAPNFSAGYDLKLLLDAAERGAWDDIDAGLQAVQQAFQRMRFAAVPVVAAPQGFALGAGCECLMYAAAVQSGPELSAGLPETQAGLVPAGGGVAELLRRSAAGVPLGGDALPALQAALTLLTAGERSSSALEALEMGLLPSCSRISRNADRRIYDARALALELARGYSRPEQAPLPVFGAGMLARLEYELYNRMRAGAITEHDRRIAARLAAALCGGRDAVPGAAPVARFLALEREALIDLAHDPLTRARMKHILATGKPLKN